MEAKQYYCITTRRFTLQCNHEEWLHKTQDFYNEVILFYYQLFLKQEEANPGSLTGKSGQQILRELEVLSIVGRDKNPVPYPLTWEKVPLYFRRAAINSAVAAAKGYYTQRKASGTAGEAKYFNKGVTYYKGMYRDLDSTSVSLKVWTGARWQWIHCRLKGREINQEAEKLSPTVTFQSQGISFMIPVKEKVADGRRIRERLQEGGRICSIQFVNSDTFAVGVVIGPDGKQEAVKFFRGGMEYTHLCSKVLEKIRISEKSMGLSGLREASGNKESGVHFNQKYWMKLKHINEYYAHRVSRQIVDFCRENQANVIVIPEYNEKFIKLVMCRIGNWSPLHLSRRIRTLLYYKAWQAELVVMEINPSNTSACCAVCGAFIKKKGKEFECPNGHRGDRQMNTARNLANKCRKDFERQRQTN